MNRGTMFRSKFTRAAAGAAGAAAMVFATASPAFAANNTVYIGSGHMTFIDEGDVFKICDTMVNGSGVYGAVFYNSYYTTSGYERVFLISDGGDSGCDSNGYDIGNSGSYTFVICPGKYPTSAYQLSDYCSHSGEFNE